MALSGAYRPLGAQDFTDALHLSRDDLLDVTDTCWQLAISAQVALHKNNS